MSTCTSVPSTRSGPGDGRKSAKLNVLLRVVGEDGVTPDPQLAVHVEDGAGVEQSAQHGGVLGGDGGEVVVDDPRRPGAA